jgi:hypothetical protein
MSGFILDDAPQVMDTQSVSCGGWVFNSWHGEMQGVQDLDNFTVYWLVMAPPSTHHFLIDPTDPSQDHIGKVQKPKGCFDQ